MKKRGKPRARTQKALHQRQPDALARKSTANTSAPRVIAVTPAYATDERNALALLLLPFLIVAMALGTVRH